MDYPEYKADLQRIHASEVYGKAVFGTAAALTFNADRKRKWLVLKELEETTLARYLAYMESTGQAIKEPTGWGLKGSMDGAGLAVLPWRLAMKLLAKGTQPFQVVFARLQSHATGEEKEFFTYVLAHEKAIEAFARRELSGQGDSLVAVERLLR